MPLLLQIEVIRQRPEHVPGTPPAAPADPSPVPKICPHETTRSQDGEAVAVRPERPGALITDGD